MPTDPHSERHAEVLVVGGGAAGLYAGVWAARAGARVAVLEGSRRAGAKVLIAGGGRCNVTHDVVRPADYCTSRAKAVVKKTLARHGVADVVAFFAERGVELKREETGKLFPVSDKARSVLDAMTSALDDAGGVLHTRSRVTAVDPRTAGGFDVRVSRSADPEPEAWTADRVVFCPGGRALPASGSDGGGYAIAERLGHTVTATWPALVAWTCEEGHWLQELPGVALPAEVRVTNANGKVLARQTGDTLVTHRGLSGPAPMDLSRHIEAARRSEPGGRLRVQIGFWPGATFDEADTRLREAAEAEPRAAVRSFLKWTIPQRLAEALLAGPVGVDPGTPLGHLKREHRRALAHLLVATEVPVDGDRGFDHAEATAGGVPLDEVDPATFQSRRRRGLFLAGEVLDVDGRIGGYNFQWAWASGFLAGSAAAAAAAV
ncbi:BaiN/RdsA family NAD(P)/FAD-dependent oxidoreductase [Phycisphaera mikurensis]|uniref:Oxidoreductase n=1 Tax=Phycisphaera mikurensis (strain NBRC 102666 / KCTC 22515 / FYK2301M01) TaxID=1142394 RepID=I0ID66_PHYMF|nr:aminoacetone oxidase family FAD-binding enzyme [Phycisphaera mikurensis]MBB6442329.1 hypothetical protein [Phycisphaera mikurensis]BAM03204.1 hypothetical protein PSMK_10450 [Phycisphaera mikurensis NBRC 102666]